MRSGYRTACCGKEQDLLTRCRTALEEGRPLRALMLPAEDYKRLKGFQFLSAKPLLLVLNLDEEDLPKANDAVQLAGCAGSGRYTGQRRRMTCQKITVKGRVSAARTTS